MPSAQGRMTVRRRPKDGNNGADSVDYKFIPSVSSIVLQKDGSLRPSALSARLVKKVGGAPEVDMIASSFEGHTVLCHIRKSNGNSTNAYTPGSSIPLSSSASATLLSIDFELMHSGKVVASITIPCIPAGVDGEDAYVLDLDNEMQGIPCNSAGTPTISGTLAETNSTVYKGSKVDSGWTFGKTDSGCTSSIDAATGKLTVTAINADKASVTVTATKGALTREAVMSLYKVKPGANGTSPVVYSIEVSDSAISKNQYGTLNPTSLTAYKNKTVGNSTARTTEMILKYQRVGQDTAETTLIGQGGEIKDLSDACTAVVITLYAANGTTVLDKERIPIVKDGADGEDVYLLDLDNEVEGIACTTAGVPTVSGVLASSNATVYKGSKVDSGWTFTNEDTGCTSTVDASTGAVSVTAISADKASVKVTATKGMKSLSAVMSLYKVKPGGKGDDAVVYSIEVSDNAISKDKDGTLNPTSISAYKIKTTGSSRTKTNEMILKYQRIGQDSVEKVLSNTNISQGGTIKDLSADCTAVVVTLYKLDGTTVLDRERIPVVKDGQDGEPGEDAYVLDLDNEVQGIPCNSSGTPTGSGTLATSQATVYKGSKVDTDWEFSISTDSSGCTASVDKTTGKVTVTAISDDKASVIVVAKKGSLIREAAMSLYKVKPGANGTSPVVYSIDSSVSALKRDSSGNLDPTSFTVYKLKTVGNTTSRTSEMTLKYQLNGQATVEATLNGEGGEIKGIYAACTSVSLTLYNGTTVLDRETIPILKDGEKGDGGVNYYIVLTPNSIYVKADGTIVADSASVSAKAYKNVGGVRSEATDGTMKLVYTKMDGTRSEVVTSGITVEGVAGYASVSFEYRVGDVTVASAALVINREGSQGMPGIVRAPLRVREWSRLAVGTEFTSGEKDGDQWTDIVYEITDKVEAGVKYWRIKKAFSKTSGQQPPASEDAFMVATSNFGSLATDIFLAHYALIKNLGVEAIEMRDGDGNLMFHAKDGTVTCNTGNFKNIHISGSSTFKGFMFREKFLVTSANYSQITKNVLAGTWDGQNQYYTLLDLEKVGNWIEVKSLPSDYSQAYFAWLPSIRIGQAYTDAYRDYVRQYMGNEIVIFNSCAKTLGIDTGANSVDIKRDMACRFKMVFDAQQIGGSGPLLERIIWEYCEPFQF